MVHTSVLVTMMLATIKSVSNCWHFVSIMQCRYGNVLMYKFVQILTMRRAALWLVFLWFVELLPAPCIKAFPPVNKSTYSCGNQSINLKWK